MGERKSIPLTTPSQIRPFPTSSTKIPFPFFVQHAYLAASLSITMFFKSLSEEEKLKIAQARNETVFKSYFLRNYRVLEQYAYTFLKDKALAQDVSSEVMWKMWHLEADLLHISNVESYLLRSVKNKCLNMLRLKQVVYVDQQELRDELLDQNHPEEIMMQTEGVKRIESAIASLPQKTKQAFKLVKEEKRSYQEVADLMNISKKTVDRHIQIALSKLWAILKAPKDSL
ncbi:sigma-70 family RNA polymerase sigma factor [Sphingobacterium humi]|uniref:Sigma-70 family RNA polymerase sigma factor n=2 Tax=Sphingobacterium humi TaxID=1796905 RepID=A0A6N8KT51_9SPHI|nr:sigma-70 family RNA polymerase sigma factor [Sphingobacterium humi]